MNERSSYREEAHVELLRYVYRARDTPAGHSLERRLPTFDRGMGDTVRVTYRDDLTCAQDP